MLSFSFYSLLLLWGLLIYIVLFCPFSLLTNLEIIFRTFIRLWRVKVALMSITQLTRIFSAHEIKQAPSVFPVPRRLSIFEHVERLGSSWKSAAWKLDEQATEWYHLEQMDGRWRRLGLRFSTKSYRTMGGVCTMGKLRFYAFANELDPPWFAYNKIILSCITWNFNVLSLTIHCVLQ